MELHLKIVGWLLIILSFVHVVFPKYFDWKNELKPLSLMNRQMMIVHTLFIALAVFLMGLLCVDAADELVHTALGKKIVLGLLFFWATRLFIQFVGYSPKLWKGKRFETIVHIIFSFLWLYISGVFFWVYQYG